MLVILWLQYSNFFFISFFYHYLNRLMGLFYLVYPFGGKVRVCFGGFAAIVSQYTLYVPHVGAPFKQMSDKTMPECMHCHLLHYSRFRYGLF